MKEFIDANIWGIIAMPFGLLLCFWPALVAWVKAEREAETSEKKNGR